MKKKQPIIVLLVLIFLVVAGAVYYEQQSRVIQDFKAISQQTRERNLNAYIQISKELGRLEKWDELQGVLEFAIKQNLIDFYAVSSGETLYWWNERNGDLRSIPKDVAPDAAEVRTAGANPIVAVATQVGDQRVTIGLLKNYDPQASVLETRKHNVTFDLMIYSVIIVLIAAAWSLKDILKIVARVRSGKIADLKTEQMGSKESDLFLRGILGYAQAVTDLEDANRRLDRQVLPSLKKEIMSGKKPPYDFFCTMVRTDINNFSTIYNTHNVTEFMATINRFFSEVSIVVARYQGLVHEFVGDEVIFYFKDDDSENSFATALSAVRDINEIAERYHRMTTEARGYSFTVKSSLSYGRVRFGPLVNGFTIAGAVLIETVRILSHIHEKDGNVVYYDSVNQSKLAGLIEGVARQRVQLKGFQNETVLFQYQSHFDLSRLLEYLDLENALRLTYYRSDRDLWSILRNLKENTRRRPIDVTLKAVEALRRPFITANSESFAPILCAWLGDLKEWRAESKAEKIDVLLATVAMLFVNLVPKEHFDSVSQEAIKSLVDAKEARIVANAIDVLTHFEKPLEKKMIQAVRKVEDLRLSANALVHEAREELKSSTIRQLSKMLLDSNPARMASGLYAIGELAKIHRERDLVYYTAQAEFTKLVAQLEAYVVHPHAMVRRQTMIALRKISDLEQITRAIETLKSTESDLLNEEASRYLNPYWQSSAPESKAA